MTGILYLCATPIGNLGDMTPAWWKRAQRGSDCGGRYAKQPEADDAF